jgi:hypothetical protein
MKAKNAIIVESSDITIIINGQKFEITKEEAEGLYNSLGKILGIGQTSDDNDMYRKLSVAKIASLQQKIRELEQQLFEEQSKPKPIVDKFPWNNPQWPQTDKPWKVPYPTYPIIYDNNLPSSTC